MSLSTLPNDLMLEVLSHSKPLDVLALRQTCRWLLDLTSDRRLWERRLRNICTERSLLRASYHLPALTLDQLQRIVSSHHLWENLVKRSSILPAQLESEMPPAMAEKAKSKAILLDELGKEDNVLLVPGGRYIVVIGLDPKAQESVIFGRILDLGFPGEPIRVEGREVLRFTVSIREYPRRGTQAIASLAVAGESSISIAVLVKPWRNPYPPWGCLTISVTIFTVDFEEGLPCLRESVTIRVKGGTDPIPEQVRPSVVGDRVLVHLGTAYFIWNFKKGWYQAWAIRKQIIPHQFVPFTGDLVIFPGTSDIAIWRAKAHPRHAVPENADIDIGKSTNLAEPHPPDHTVRYPFGPFVPSSFLFTISVSESFQSLPMLFDVLHRNTGMRLQLSQIQTPDGLDNFEIEYLTCYGVGRPFDLHKSWPGEEVRLGWGSAALVRPAMGRRCLQPCVVSLAPKETTNLGVTSSNSSASEEESEGYRGAWQGKTEMMVSPLLPLGVNPSWVSGCSTSGRVIYMVDRVGAIGDDRGVWSEYWCLDLVH